MRYAAFVFVLLFHSLVLSSEDSYLQAREACLALRSRLIAAALLHNASYETSGSSRFLQFEQNGQIGDCYSDVEWQEIVSGPRSPTPSNDEPSRSETLISSSMPSKISRSYQPLYVDGLPTKEFFEALEDENSELQQCSRIMMKMAADQQRS